MLRALTYRIVPSAVGAICLAIAAGLGVYLLHMDLAWQLSHPQYGGLALLLAVSGGCGLVLMLSHDALESRATRLIEENVALSRGRDDFIERSLRFEKRIESLAVIREIHRTSNINDREERLRRLLWVLGDLSSAEDVSLFYHLPAGGACPAAYLKAGEGFELFLCFDRPRVGEAPPEGGLSCRDPVAAHRNGKLNLVGTLLAGGEAAGRVELAVERPQRERPSEDDHLGLMERFLSRPRIEPGRVAEALEHKRLMRMRDSGSGRVELAVPLMAEAQLVGALQVRLRADRIAHVRLSDVEEVLVEAGKHIAMAMKKDEDSVRAVTDALTGLLIKRAFTSRMNEEFETARNTGVPYTLVMVDIDHFKKVNDKHGHSSGDRILRGVARVLRQNLRAGDVAFRYGGEELAAVLPGTPKAEAKKTAERLRKAIAGSQFHGDRDQVIGITISLGVAEYEEKLASPAELFSRADQALYRAKKSGRDCVRVWPLRTRRTSRSKRTKKAAAPKNSGGSGRHKKSA